MQFHPFHTALWVVRYPFGSRVFYLFGIKLLVYVFVWEVTNKQILQIKHKLV